MRESVDEHPAPGAQGSLFDPGDPSLAAMSLISPTGVPRYEDVVLSASDELDAERRWPDLTESMRRHRMKLSILARLKHAVVVEPGSGRRAFGGVQPQPRRKKRLDEILVDVAEARQKEIIDATFSVLGPDNDNWARHRGAMNVQKMVREVHEMELKEDALDRASRDDLARESAILLAQLVREGSITAEEILGEVVDAESVEV